MNKQEILLACKVEGTVIKLPSVQLERKLYQEVAKALELIGGKWKGGKVAGFEFPEDPTDLLAQIANGDSRNLKKEYQFFETPADIADWLVHLAEVKASHYILEPSAGQGAIIKAIQRVLPKKAVAYCELMPLNKCFIERIPKVVELSADFFDQDKTNSFDRIIANPPFSKNQDVDHVLKMYQCLKPGGRLVSIMSKHWQHCNNRKETEFRKWLVSVKAKTHTIPAGKFKSSGTMIETIAVVINKSLIVNPSPVPKAIVNSKSSNSKSMPTHSLPSAPRSMPLVCQAALKLEIYPPNARALVMQYFIHGGKINPDALQSLFGNKAGKSIESERKARFTWCSKTDGNSIDQIAHFLWEQNLNLDSDFNIETEEFRDAVEDIILSYNSPVQMAKDLMAQYNPEQEIPEDAESVETGHGTYPEPIVEEEPQKTPATKDEILEAILEYVAPYAEKWHNNHIKTIQFPYLAERLNVSVAELIEVYDNLSQARSPIQQKVPKTIPVTAPAAKPIVNSKSVNGKSPAPVPVPVQTRLIASLQIVRYTDKSVALIGDTRPLKDQLAALWGKYCPNLHIEGKTVKGWIFSAKREPQLKQLIASRKSLIVNL